MARRRRPLSPFSLAFLDVISCGFGAAVLLFLLIKHGVPSPAELPVPDAASVAGRLETLQAARETEAARLAELTTRLARLSTQSDDREAALAAQRAELAKATTTLERLEQARARMSAVPLDSPLEQLQSQLATARAERDVLRRALGTSEAPRRFTGDGEREYITGIKMAGKMQVILLDTSASMLDETLVNILRIRNLPADARQRAPKWQRSLSILEWLTARLPLSAEVRIMTFSDTARPVVPVWIRVSDGAGLEAAVAGARGTVPSGGTSLAAAFEAIAQLTPVPDVVHLITDGLPTLDASGRGQGRISSEQRLKLFASAVKRLPPDIPVNIILLPLEGDPAAASAYWRLAQATAGTLVTPSADWP